MAYHLWRSIENLYQAPLSEHRLQNICTCIRDDMDKMYGHFWQVLVNRTEAFGLASAHMKATRHVVDQHGVYRDGRVFSFNNIVFKCIKPSRKGKPALASNSCRTFLAFAMLCRRGGNKF